MKNFDRDATTKNHVIGQVDSRGGPGAALSRDVTENRHTRDPHASRERADSLRDYFRSCE